MTFVLLRPAGVDVEGNRTNTPKRKTEDEGDRFVPMDIDAICTDAKSVFPELASDIKDAFRPHHGGFFFCDRVSVPFQQARVKWDMTKRMIGAIRGYLSDKPGKKWLDVIVAMTTDNAVGHRLLGHRDKHGFLVCTTSEKDREICTAGFRIIQENLNGFSDQWRVNDVTMTKTRVDTRRNNTWLDRYELLWHDVKSGLLVWSVCKRKVDKMKVDNKNIDKEKISVCENNYVNIRSGMIGAIKSHINPEKNWIDVMEEVLKDSRANKHPVWGVHRFLVQDAANGRLTWTACKKSGNMKYENLSDAWELTARENKGYIAHFAEFLSYKYNVPPLLRTAPPLPVMRLLPNKRDRPTPGTDANTSEAVVRVDPLAGVEVHSTVEVPLQISESVLRVARDFCPRLAADITDAFSKDGGYRVRLGRDVHKKVSDEISKVIEAVANEYVELQSRPSWERIVQSMDEDDALAIRLLKHENRHGCIKHFVGFLKEKYNTKKALVEYEMHRRSTLAYSAAGKLIYNETMYRKIAWDFDPLFLTDLDISLKGVLKGNAGADLYKIHCNIKKFVENIRMLGKEVGTGWLGIIDKFKKTGTNEKSGPSTFRTFRHFLKAESTQAARDRSKSTGSKSVEVYHHVEDKKGCISDFIDHVVTKYGLAVTGASRPASPVMSRAARKLYGQGEYQMHRNLKGASEDVMGLMNNIRKIGQVCNGSSTSRRDILQSFWKFKHDHMDLMEFELLTSHDESNNETRRY